MKLVVFQDHDLIESFEDHDINKYSLKFWKLTNVTSFI